MSTVRSRLRSAARHYPKTTLAGLTVAALFLVFLSLDQLAPLPHPAGYSRVVTARDGTVLHAFLSPDDKWRMKTELTEITPELRAAFLHKEDQFFYYHPGVNPLALARAALNNVLAGRKTSGASTITMQVARLLEPKERTYWHKLVEMFRALQLEWHYSKDEIFQLYLNLVPYGGNIEGVKAASLLYFGRLPDKLSLAQITTLAIVPNRPTSLALGRHNDRIQQARNLWLARFQAEGVFPAADLADAQAEPLQAQRQQAPVMAPHFARFAHRQQPSPQANLRTTLRADFQAKVEELTAGYVRSTRAFNIHNASVLVVDNRSRQVLAYLGSPDFADGQHGGQVDGARAYRSPGSALKPFIYAAAFDRGLITPRTLITDVPTDFAGYAPENYNRTFNGQVSAETALANSLNVPAVKLLHQLSVSRLVDLLKQAKCQEISKKEKMLGLSLALGGCGVSLWEMAGLYAALANQGRWQPLQWLADAPSPPLPDSLRQTQLVSPAAAYVVSEILTKVNRPELPADYERNPHVPKIAWKTGTSYGRRDAWSIGYNAKFTVAVWVGNFSGEGSPELTGAGMATPLLFKLFNALDYNAPIDWLAPPEELQFRLVCAESGQVPEAFCENLVQDYFLPGVSPIKKCEHARPVFVSPDEKISYCIDCLPAAGYKKKLYPNLTPEMVAFNLSNKVAFMPIPVHNPACTRVAGGQAPVITSPVPGREYLTADDEGIELLLSCNPANEVKKVYWYVDKKFYRAATVGENVFFKPRRGEIQISCSDDQGRNSNISITVK
ncbi:MAG: penicillin-binding protein 1C [Bernardetiaceae bacterium]|nr:penicillin-binding protein 1C [Bernardetiaceae bacterium]